LRALLLFIAVLSFSAYGQKLEFKPIPEWVKPIDPVIESKFNKYDINNGSYYSVIDYQIHLDLEADYTHFATKITSNAGITEASELTFSYDTNYQRVEFHTLTVWRKGKPIDRIKELEFEFLSNEQNLDQGIYTGAVTAYKILEDIREGDIIEFAYTIVGDNPIYNDQRFRLLPLENTNPLDHIHINILYPKNQEFYMGCQGCDEKKIIKTEHTDYNQVELSRTDLEAKELEESSPNWIIPYDYFYFSSTNSWKEINDWAVDVFSLKNQQDLQSVFDEVLIGNETDEEKIDKLLDFVQNDIRYMGIESGIGSIKPFSPEKVVKQRFGDCKDKSLLFVELMRQIGITTAYPALVSANMWHGVDSITPTGYSFDHVIVCLDYKGDRYWIDPTMTNQGGSFKQKMITNFGLALPISEGNESLSEMNINDTISRTYVEEHLESNSFQDPIKLTVTSTLYGMNAEYFRSILEYYSLKEASEQLKGLYTNLFPTIMVSERIKIIDDLDSNKMVIVEQYEIPNAWREDDGIIGKVHLIQYEPIPLYGYVSYLTCEKKELPVQLGYPSKYDQKTSITLPKDLAIMEKNDEYENEGFLYSSKMIEKSGNEIELKYHYEIKQSSITPKEYQQFCLDMNALLYDLPVKITFSKDFNQPKGRKINR